MHLDPVIEVQNQQPGSTLRVERLLKEAEALSPEESLQFFSRWMEKQDVSTRLTIFLACMRSEKDDKLKKTLFVSWMRAESGNRKLLKEIAIKASAVLVTKGFTKIDHSKIDNWIKAAVEKDDGRSTYEIAHTCKNYFRLPHLMSPMVKREVRTAKDNFRVKKWRSEKKAGTGRTRPSYNTSLTERVLAEGLYSVDLPPAETGRPHNVTPAPLAVVPSLDCQRRIEDYETLIAPHRSLIGKIGSLDALAEVLRILYDGGEVPSVVCSSGRTYDGEYTKLREHKPFLEILEKVSLYDHTYNVLKAALDTAQNDLRRYELFIPSIITAALAHDLGKIPSLWSASSLRKNGHEPVGAATLTSLLVGHRNEEFTKSVINAIRYHHANIEIDTVARVILAAEAKAREHEIMAADTRFTVKPLRDWLDLTRFAELLLPAVNQLTIKNRQARWNAISFQGVVYCMPDHVRQLLSRLALENHIIDYRLVRASFREDHRSVLADFADMLRDRGLLAWRISEGLFGLKFLFRSSLPALPEMGFLTIPIKAELFPVLPSELERAKTDYLKTIVSVSPSGKRY
ncbi:MAG: HD domain-containing protein [Syntrophorhabdales bacterium]|jgi:hypothetical protein